MNDLLAVILASVTALAILGELWYQRIRRSRKRKRKNKYVHISDLFTKFEDYCQENGLIPDWPLLKEWADNVYQAYHFYFFVDYSLPEEIVLEPSGPHILQVAITNKSNMTIPSEKYEFKLFAYLGEAINKGSNFKLLSPYTPLPRQNINPGQTIIVEQKITAPDKPGRYDVNVDILSQFGHTFEAKGSPIGTFRLIVSKSST